MEKTSYQLPPGFRGSVVNLITPESSRPAVSSIHTKDSTGGKRKAAG